MSRYDDEIRTLNLQIQRELGSSMDRLDEQLAKQQASYLRAALDALRNDDPVTAMNMVLQAKLVAELRSKGVT